MRQVANYETLEISPKKLSFHFKSHKIKIFTSRVYLHADFSQKKFWYIFLNHTSGHIRHSRSTVDHYRTIVHILDISSCFHRSLSSTSLSSHFYLPCLSFVFYASSFLFRGSSFLFCASFSISSFIFGASFSVCLLNSLNFLKSLNYSV